MTIFKRSEYIGDINGASAFTIVKTLIINPGNYQLNPWLQPIANQYEQYRYKSIRFRYKPVVSDATNGVLALGTIAMGFDPNVTNPAWTSKAEFLQFQGSVDVRVSRELIYNVKNVNRWNNYLVANSQTMAAFQATNTYYQDPKTIWPGTFYIAVANNAVTTQIGELYIDYEIELIKAKISGLGTIGTGYVVSAYSTQQNGLYAFNTNASGTNRYKTLGTLNFYIDNEKLYLLPGWPVGMAFRLSYFYQAAAIGGAIVPFGSSNIDEVSDVATLYSGIAGTSKVQNSSSTNLTGYGDFVCKTAPTTNTSVWMTLPTFSTYTTGAVANVTIMMYPVGYVT